MSLRVHVSRQTILVTNLGGSAIDGVTLTTYPGPVDGRLLLLPYGFTKSIGRLDRNATVVIALDELANDNNVPLSEASRKYIGVCHVMGKIQGKAVGQAYVRDGERFVPADSKIVWGGITDPILGPVDGAAGGQLDVDVFTTAMSNELQVIVINKGKLVRDLLITAYPPLTERGVGNVAGEYTHTVARLPPGESVSLSAADFKSPQGSPLNDSIKIRVLRLERTVGGERSERYVTRPAEEPPS